MAERIDFLIPFGPADNGLPYFVVDTNVGYVPVQVGAGTNSLYNGNGCRNFARGDSFTILSAGIVMPLSFQFDKSQNPTYQPYIGISLLAGGLTTAVTYYFQELYSGAFAFIYLPAENYDTPLDIYIDLPNEPASIGQYIINERFLLFTTLNEPDIAVSMAGVPASLQGTTQYITPYVKILHTLPLANV